ncbi:MAG TPA: hypothetical protein VK599_09445, partial [Streptosporangiaceae bacterium]|nr:hypothetical protein [Streptosporangiaceae bacterium]
MTGPDERARFVDGLRVLASALEQHPEIPLPVNGTDEPFRWNFFGAGGSDPRDAMADAVRALPCAWSKE